VYGELKDGHLVTSSLAHARRSAPCLLRGGNVEAVTCDAWTGVETSTETKRPYRFPAPPRLCSLFADYSIPPVHSCPALVPKYRSRSLSASTALYTCALPRVSTLRFCIGCVSRCTACAGGGAPLSRFSTVHPICSLCSSTCDHHLQCYRKKRAPHRRRVYRVCRPIADRAGQIAQRLLVAKRRLDVTLAGLTLQPMVLAHPRLGPLHSHYVKCIQK